MPRICRCQAYGYVQHMYFSLFPAQIRKKTVPDLLHPHRRAAAQKHKMWRHLQLLLLPDVVL